MKKALLFLVFNRLDSTKQVFEQIRLAKPPKFYIACDGPRKDKEGEKQLVDELRNWILSNIDWDCEVKKLFRAENLGCGPAVSSAITWFFEHESDGIILEDDCLPSQSFFSYCEELLDLYKDDKRVWHIGGFNAIDFKNYKYSYYSSKIAEIWGWATWADRWKNYKFDLTDYSVDYVKNFSKRYSVRHYWTGILNLMKEHKINTWDYQWVLEIVKNNGICLAPTKNLITNIGATGTHYEDNSESESDILFLPNCDLGPIVHPANIEINNTLMDKIYLKLFNIKKKFIKIYKDENNKTIVIADFIKICIKRNRERSYQKLFLTPDCYTKCCGIFKTEPEAYKKFPILDIKYQDIPVVVDESFASREYKINEEFDLPVINWFSQVLTSSSIVLDFGGGIGGHFYAYKNHLHMPENVSWNVIEIPQRVEIGNKMAEYKKDTRLKLYDDFSLVENPNIFFASGSLQYINTKLFNALFEKSKYEHIILNRFPLYFGKSFITVQNGGNEYVLQYIHNKSEFIDLLTRNGYDLIDEWTEDYDGFTINPAARKKLASSVIYYGFYFKKRNTV